jgi:hypothetical protein
MDNDRLPNLEFQSFEIIIEIAYRKIIKNYYKVGIGLELNLVKK